MRRKEMKGKLFLNKETVADLDLLAMSRVLGGDGDVGVTCPQLQCNTAATCEAGSCGCVEETTDCPPPSGGGLNTLGGRCQVM